MPSLFLIDGVPGSGKSELIKHCAEDNSNVFIKKYTTKEKDFDGFEREDLVYISEEEFQQLDIDDYFQYQYPKRSPNGRRVKYLISKKHVETALKSNRNVFIIVRSHKVIEEIRQYFSQYININIVSIFTYCNTEKLVQRTENQIKNQNDVQLEETVLQEMVNNRLNRSEECIQSYFRSIDNKTYAYDYVIINDLDRDDYYDCIDRIVDSYSNFDKAFIHPKVFVIMPMPQTHEGAHFYRVKEAIYQGAKQAGFSAVRQDDQHYSQNSLVTDIMQSIKEATICIADLTNSRPNCYFEAGLAFGKSSNVPTVLLIAEKGTKIDFDLDGIGRSEYVYSGNDYDGITILVKKLLEEFKSNHIFS